MVPTAPSNGSSNIAWYRLHTGQSYPKYQMPASIFTVPSQIGMKGKFGDGAKNHEGNANRLPRTRDVFPGSERVSTEPTPDNGTVVPLSEPREVLKK
jgi:hypothetical protein